ncbi:MAG: hypothetical protein J5800_01635 [Spirochaetales bacterium]|nr:hypothetical protein [Spirochaetales bacterium]
MKNFFIWLLAFTWELPQTLVALIFMLFFRTWGMDGKGRVRRVHFNSYLTCFSLGEFLFFAQRDLSRPSWDETVRHETGHSIQSRIFGPLYLILIALPSVIWNALARMDNRSGRWFSRHYYDTPWEHGADVLGKVKR